MLENHVNQYGVDLINTPDINDNRQINVFRQTLICFQALKLATLILMSRYLLDFGYLGDTCSRFEARNLERASRSNAKQVSKMLRFPCVLQCFVTCAILGKSASRKQERQETCNKFASKRFKLGPTSKGEANEQRREGQRSIWTLKDRFFFTIWCTFWAHAVYVFL